MRLARPSALSIAILAASTLAGAARLDDPPGSRTVSGRVIDGLGRPVAGVRVLATSAPTFKEEDGVSTVTSADGRYALAIPAGKASFLAFSKQGHAERGTVDPDTTEVELLRRASLGSLQIMVLGDEGKVDDDDVERLREALASSDWDGGDDEADKVPAFLFAHQAEVRPIARRLIDDPIVGETARGWLDGLADPGDDDLFPKGRDSMPKHAIREADLVEAIRATARKVNFFTSAPEPRISIDSITLTPGLDRAEVRCGINVAAMTGIFWRFVFHKEGATWVLKAMEQTGRA